jgi:hypothetical protein
MIMTQQDERKILKKIRGIIVFFMIALALSGITAFPIETELNTFFSVTGINSESVKDDPEIFKFLHYIKENVTETNQKAPQLAYGCDWLAFAHLVIALLFIGPYRDPVRNKWVIQWGMIACVSNSSARLHLRPDKADSVLLATYRLLFRSLRNHSSASVHEIYQGSRERNLELRFL